MNSRGVRRDHLFISYASEDGILADWLVLKLTSEGYKVWYDRLKMLGGESYPIDITEAIKDQTFRVIALLSKNSISKPNPLKERTLALNIAKERGIKDFLIPLNIDGLRASELDFQMSDLVYIPFHKSWYKGISNLLKKLNQINTPKNPEIGQKAISQWLSTEERPIQKDENIWSNLLPIIEFPIKIKRFNIAPEIDIESVVPDWLFYRESEATILAFNSPEYPSNDWLTEIETIEYHLPDSLLDKTLRRAITILLRTGLRRYCINKGLIFDEKKRLYFPPDLLPNNRLSFNRYDGKKIYIKVVGERKFRLISQGTYITETSRYHIWPDFRFYANLLGDPVIQLQIKIFWTNLEGQPLEPKTANRRRKKLCKNWWNYEWLSRMMALMQWLGDGQDEISLIESDYGKLRIGLNPLSFSSRFGIDEEMMAPIEDDEDSVIEDTEEIEEEEDGEENDST